MNCEYPGCRNVGTVRLPIPLDLPRAHAAESFMRSHDLGHLVDDVHRQPYTASKYACSEHWKLVRMQIGEQANPHRAAIREGRAK